MPRHREPSGLYGSRCAAARVSAGTSWYTACMSKSDVLQIRNLCRAAQEILGSAASSKVMSGSREITAGTRKTAVTAWVRCALQRLGAVAPKAKARSVMRSCGHACAAQHAAMALGMRRRFQRSTDLDSFLAEETRRCGGGLRYARRGDVIEHVYEPRAFRHPMRCYCGLTKGLKEGERLPAAFCECSAGFVEHTWTVVLSEPVRVKLLESAVTGGEACRFEVLRRRS